eukprot:366417-Chlamydomonas_euryale.AAC.21
MDEPQVAEGDTPRLCATQVTLTARVRSRWCPRARCGGQSFFWAAATKNSLLPKTLPASGIELDPAGATGGVYRQSLALQKALLVTQDAAALCADGAAAQRWAVEGYGAVLGTEQVSPAALCRVVQSEARCVRPHACRRSDAAAACVKPRHQHLPSPKARRAQGQVQVRVEWPGRGRLELKAGSMAGRRMAHHCPKGGGGHGREGRNSAGEVHGREGRNSAGEVQPAPPPASADANASPQAARKPSDGCLKPIS